MVTTNATPDPLGSIPDPKTLRAEIAASVRRTQILRQMLRIAVRLESTSPPLAQAAARREMVHAG